MNGVKFSSVISCSLIVIPKTANSRVIIRKGAEIKPEKFVITVIIEQHKPLTLGTHPRTRTCNAQLD